MKKIILILILCATPMLSMAQRSVHCTNCATESTAGNILNTLKGGIDRIVGAIQGASTAQTTAVQESAKMVADSTAATSAAAAQADIERQGKLLDPCGVTAISQGAASGASSGSSRPGGVGRSGGGGGGMGGGGGTPTRGASAEMAKALQISSGETKPPPPEVTAALAAGGACSTFTSGGSRERVCKNAGFSVGASSGFVNADIQAETLFDGPQTRADVEAGQIKRKLTIGPGNSSERMAINAFVRNLESPLDLRELEPNELRREAGRNYMSMKDTYEARLSLATKPLRDQTSMTTANRSTLPILQQMLLGEDAQFVQDYLTRAYSNWRVDGISFAQLIDLESAKRYLNPKWQERMAKANEKQLLSEQVQMMAFSGFVSNLSLERQQQQAMLLGGIAGAGIRQELLPQLSAQHRAAIAK